MSLNITVLVVALLTLRALLITTGAALLLLHPYRLGVKHAGAPVRMVWIPPWLAVLLHVDRLHSVCVLGMPLCIIISGHLAAEAAEDLALPI